MDNEIRNAFIESLKFLGFSQEDAEITLNRLIIIQKGRLWKHAHLMDIPKVVHRALDWQDNEFVILKISKEGKEGEDYNDHLEIEVIDIQKGNQS